jgi:hypothetical protein
MSDNKVRGVAHRLWIVRSSAGVQTDPEKNWSDAEELIQNKSPEEIEIHLKNLPIVLASEEYYDDEDYEATRPDCVLAGLKHV